MKQILLVRMSSLGDILHTFPAATDLRRALPDAQLDWVVEEAYVPLVHLHPGVTAKRTFSCTRSSLQRAFIRLKRRGLQSG